MDVETATMGRAITKEHRIDIQGLRAVCILSVVFYHAHVPGFAGGFVGVDVFFVISGFLIVGMLLDEVEATSRVDLARFWARRVRRLLPNAMLALGVTLLVGALLIPPHAREMLAKEVAFAALNVANYHFAGKAVDYFHFDDQLSPVLHYWSLSIEEQFYIVWPIVLLAASAHPRFRRFAAPVLLGLVWVASFTFCMLVVRDNQPLAFFHTETRCWQLATGGLAAVLVREYGRLPRIFGWLGLLGIVTAIAGLSDRISYPNSYALLPTMSAAAIVLAERGQRDVSSLLGQPPFQWVGARSYSWYLWHWPVLIYAGVVFPETPYVAVLTLPASLIISHLAFKYVEHPIHRNEEWRYSAPWCLVAGGGAVAIVVAISVASLRMPGIGANANANAGLVQAVKRAAADRGRNYADRCHLGYESAPQEDCAYGATSSARRVVLFGDSHAAQWFEPVDAAAKLAGWKFHAWTKTSCPSVDVTVWYKPRRAAYTECDEWRRAVTAALAGAQRPDLVLISNHTDYGGWLQDRKTGDVLERDEARRAWQAGLRETLARLTNAGVPVVLVRDTPRALKSVHACLAKGGGTSCDRLRSQAVEEPAIDVAIAREFADRGVSVLDLTDHICDSVVCPTLRDDIVVYLDSHHVTATFAATLSAEFLEVLSRFAGGAAQGH